MPNNVEVILGKRNKISLYIIYLLFFVYECFVSCTCGPQRGQKKALAPLAPKLEATVSCLRGWEWNPDPLEE